MERTAVVRNPKNIIPRLFSLKSLQCPGQSGLESYRARPLLLQFTDISIAGQEKMNMLALRLNGRVPPEKGDRSRYIRAALYLGGGREFLQPARRLPLRLVNTSDGPHK